MQFTFNRTPQVNFNQLYMLCKGHTECVGCPILETDGLHLPNQEVQLCGKVILKMMNEPRKDGSRDG